MAEVLDNVKANDWATLQQKLKAISDALARLDDRLRLLESRVAALEAAP